MPWRPCIVLHKSCRVCTACSCLQHRVGSHDVHWLNSKWNIGNWDLYLNETLLSVGYCHICQPIGELFTQYSKVYDGHGVLSEMRIKQVLIHEAQRFSGDGVWDGLWQLAAVTNVIEQPVQVMYPLHLCCCVTFNHIFMPHDTILRSRHPITLMWTTLKCLPSVRDIQQHHLVHFVLLIQL